MSGSSVSRGRFWPTTANPDDRCCVSGTIGGRGPSLDVEIRLPVSELERYRVEGKGRIEPLPYRARAIVDTGAERTCIRARTAATLLVDPVSRSLMSSAFGLAERDVFCLSLQLGVTLERLPEPIEVFAHSVPEILGAELLIGLDVLTRCELTLFGPERRFELLLP